MSCGSEPAGFCVLISLHGVHIATHHRKIKVTDLCSMARVLMKIVKNPHGEDLTHYLHIGNNFN